MSVEYNNAKSILIEVIEMFVKRIGPLVLLILVTEALKNGEYCMASFQDFSKACVCASHPILRDILKK